MQNYVVLARKYRPKNFKYLVGQDYLVSILSNAIKSNSVAHAYLLTGIRGIGKTTTARIIAKTINCTNKITNEIVLPCEECDNCQIFNKGNHPDILEMDAASNTSVNDIRDIIDNVNYVPNIAKYKVYIIDEVHMLSKSAFNALLKTLEEPPSHVKFIFATTEAGKIPLTVISRCQRFDLTRLNNNLMIEHLKNVAKLEELSFEEEIIEMIAQASEGSVRDALSLLDSIIAYSFKEKISPHEAQKILGINDYSAIFKIFEAIFNNSINDALNIINDLYYNGANIGNIIDAILYIINVISKVKITNSNITNIQLNEENKQKILEYSKELSTGYLMRAWQVTIQYKEYEEELINLEMLIISLYYLNDTKTPAELVNQIHNIKNGNNQLIQNAKKHFPNATNI